VGRGCYKVNMDDKQGERKGKNQVGEAKNADLKTTVKITRPNKGNPKQHKKKRFAKIGPGKEKGGDIRQEKKTERMKKRKGGGKKYEGETE